MWGEQELHGNALHIYLPSSKTTWIYLNLDSNILDFTFWIAHELGHTLASILDGDEAEDFADAFAQSLLYSEERTRRLYRKIERLPTIRERIRIVLTEAKKHTISPYTIYKALEAYAKWHDMPKVDLGKSFMGVVTNFTKKYPTVLENLFESDDLPDAKEYITISEKTFETPIFNVLRAYEKQTDGFDHYIHNILDVPLADAKAIYEALA